MLDILCIGDALVDIFLQIPKDNPHFGLDKEKNKLFIDYGYKIGVENYVKDIGGNACNAAVGLARLGKKAGLCAEIGNDEFSNFIINRLLSENINTTLINQSPDKKTSFSVSLNYLGERTLFVEHVQRLHNFNFQNSSARFVYLTSLGKDWENAYEKTLDFIKQTDSILAFNPGTLQIDNKLKIVDELIQSCDYLFLNKQEAQKILYGKDVKLSDVQESIEKILFGLKSLGAKNVIITDSKNGSFITDELNNSYYLDIIKTEVLEKTGAGDGYTAGFLAAILNGENVQSAMIWGSINAAAVIQKVGAQEGLLKHEKLKDKLSYLGNYKPQKI
jgi:5-dehydro-2-deoxygluconokinase